MNLKQAYRESITVLRSLYDEGEAHSINSLLFEDIGYTHIDIHRFPEQEFSEEENKRLNQLLDKLRVHMPVQYALGYAYFLERKFSVTPECLIPRSETEELVSMIRNSGRPVKKILDIGTGSGCIAISLKIAFPETIVYAMDKYPGPLNVAKENAARYNARIKFIQGDILSEGSGQFPDELDIIVSNPPYVRESEKTMMKKNVLDYEPDNALFVRDEDPLIFYRAIRNFSDHHLGPGGEIYLEINESMGKKTSGIFRDDNYNETKIIKDIHNRDRFIKVLKK